MLHASLLPPLSTLSLLLAIAGIAPTHAHPSCLNDSIAPSYGGTFGQLQFCTDARIGVARIDGACCEQSDDKKIQKYFNWLTSSAVNIGLTTPCRDAVRRIVCMGCHPFSGHLYANASLNSQGQPKYPLLCVDKQVSIDFKRACGALAPGSLILTQLQPLHYSINNYCFPYPVSNFWNGGNYSELGSVPLVTEAFNFSSLGGQALPAAMVGAYIVPRTNLWWGLSQSGTIVEWENINSVTTYRTVLALKSPLTYKASGSEGLLGLCFHPQWAIKTGKKQFWLYYSTVTSASLRGSRVSRFDYEGIPSPNSTALLATEVPILEFDQPSSASHKGGRCFFGRDRMMYVASGDGGDAQDIGNNAQNTQSLLGKILRLDVLSGYAARGLALAPNDAVNVGGGASGSNADLVYALGLRSPATFVLDGFGDMWVANVGEADREALYRVTARANFGWRTLEGTRCNVNAESVNATTCASMAASAGAVAPTLEYCHDNNVPGCPLTQYCEAGATAATCKETFMGQSIIIGQRYRGQKFPRLRGHFIYVDYQTTAIHVAFMSPADGPAPVVTGDRLINAVHRALSAVIEDQNGELLFVSHSYSAPSKIYSLSCSPDLCCTNDTAAYPDAPLCVAAQ